jgi:hemerythrin
MLRIRPEKLLLTIVFGAFTMIEKLCEWDDSLLIGIEELDYEHKVLIEDINRLHAELTCNAERSVIAKCLGDVHSRMLAHFALEEHVMKEHKYAFFDEHKREHDEFLEDYMECMMKFLNGAEVSSKNPIEECLKEWVINHITTSDKKMSLMIRDVG